jgi:pimeloyl-ACP methyl ester carboxylesterase
MPMLHAADLEVHYIEAGAPAGVPVLFVHGNWGTASWWEPLLTRLPAGYRGLAYDVRGRGKTAGPDSSYAIDVLAADLLAFATAAQADRFHLVGHSLGTAIAMQAALDAPGRVRSLAAIAPAWVDGMPAAYNVPAGQIAIKNDAALFAIALKPLAPTAPDDDYWKRLMREGHGQRIEAALRNLDALLAWRPGDRLAAITAPRLVIAGTLDPLTGGANADRAAAALGARLVTLDGVGHSPNIESPDRVAALLAELWRE